MATPCRDCREKKKRRPCGGCGKKKRRAARRRVAPKAAANALRQLELEQARVDGGRPTVIAALRRLAAPLPPTPAR